MKELISQVKQAFTANGGVNIYTSFDALPVRNKGRFFTVLGIEAYEELNPIYSAETISVPVKAEVTVSVLAPENSTQDQLYDYYADNFEQAADKLCGLSSCLKSIDIDMDKKLSRLVLKAVLKVSGMKNISRTAVTE